jgi:hypothetical protein
MIRVSLSWRYVSRRFVAGALAATACAAASAQQTVEPLEHWAATHAVLIRTVEPGSDVADLRQLVPVIETARVVA